MSNDISPKPKKEITLNNINHYEQLSKSDNIRVLKTNIINITNNVSLVRNHLNKLGFSFGKIGGEFLCNENKLFDLIGMPHTVTDRCRIDCNRPLTSFKGGPEYVGNYFDASRCSIVSFEHCPKFVGEEFDISSNRITSLVSIHKNLIQCGSLNLNRNNIQEGGIGLLLINDLRKVIFEAGPDSYHSSYSDKEASDTRSFKKALSIIRPYLCQKDKILKCQEELIDAGLERFAIL